MKGFIAKLIAATALTGAATVMGGAALPSANASVAARPAMVAAVSSCRCDSPWTPAKQAFAVSLPALREGSSGAYVLALQGALMNTGEIGPILNGTGYFGANTKAAVQAFQRRHHINPSGLVGFTTWVTLMESNRVTPKYLANPQVSPGQRWPSAALRYNTLVAIDDLMDRFNWATLPNAAGGSVYSGAFVATVKSFQSRVGITPSGIFGAKTAAALSVVDTMLGRCGC